MLNRAELARSIDSSERTVGRYLDVICSTFLARVLKPWHANTSKRQLKSPKVCLRDSGVLHSLLGIDSRHDLLGHPKLGGSFEGFALGEVVRRLGAEAEECYFWALHSGLELDLFVVRGARRLGFEIKFSDRPKVTRSMHGAREALELDEIVLVHPGERSFPLSEGFRALALHRIDEDLERLPRQLDDTELWQGEHRIDSLDPGDELVVRPCIVYGPGDRAADELGFAPRWRLVEGMAGTVTWYREADWLQRGAVEYGGETVGLEPEDPELGESLGV